MNEDGKDHPEVIKIMNYVFPIIINLGCDSDVLVRQLFEPLVLQIIHYQTNRQKITSKETDILIDSIMVCSLCVIFSFCNTKQTFFRMGSHTLKTLH